MHLRNQNMTCHSHLVRIQHPAKQPVRLCRQCLCFWGTRSRLMCETLRVSAEPSGDSLFQQVKHCPARKPQALAQGPKPSGRMPSPIDFQPQSWSSQRASLSHTRRPSQSATKKKRSIHRKCLLPGQHSSAYRAIGVKATPFLVFLMARPKPMPKPYDPRTALSCPERRKAGRLSLARGLKVELFHYVF